MDRSEADALFQRAMELQQGGRWHEARPLYEQVLQAYNDYPHAGHLLGVIASHEGDWFLARRLIETTLRAQPPDADPLANLAWVLVHLGLHEQALQRCAEALVLEPGHPRALVTRGLALRLLQRHEEAVAAFDAALAQRGNMADALLYRGQSLHALKRHDAALASLAAVLALQPDHADALNSLGITLAVLGRNDEAVAAFERALALNPRFAEAHFNLGLQHHNAKRFEASLACYEAALALRPDYPEALMYRAFALQRLRRSAHACLASLDRALALRPDYFEALNGRANVLGQLGQYAEAVADYDRALAIDPVFHEAHFNRAHALRELGRVEEAAAGYRDAARFGGNARYAHFALAAMGQDEAPGIAPPDYIVNLFDGYAERFDEHLVGQLKYQAHERVCEALLRERPPAGDVLDLGCGTGLCAPLLQPVARSMTGVDLSPKMLEAAGRRGIYTALACRDIAEFLAAQQAPAWDLAVSTDVFIYIGELAPVFEGMRRALRAGGLFGFSIESAPQGDFVLQATRRYAHSPAYIRRLAAAHGFDELRFEPCVIRKERSVDTPGHVVVLRAR